jgi:D-tyrosyl-tRNA(Tyr) deacylase
MISLIQRVTQASVVIAGETIARIDSGLLALIAIEHDDGDPQVQRMTQRLLSYRVFADAAGKMNLSLRQTEGGLLLVPQFTLLADTTSGNRPSFSKSPEAALGKACFEQLCVHAKTEYSRVTTGIFGADMQVSLVNDGPVTFSLKVS